MRGETECRRFFWGPKLKKTKPRIPGYVRYPDKWIADTFSLSDAAYRAYDMILSRMWLNGGDHCSLANDEKVLRRATGFSEKKLRRAMKEIQFEGNELLRLEDGRLVSHG